MKSFAIELDEQTVEWLKKKTGLRGDKAIRQWLQLLVDAELFVLKREGQQG